MAISVELNVGPQAVAAGDGVDINSRAGRTGDQIVTELHAPYFESARSGKSFHAGNQAAQAVSVALATTYTGLLLYNPLNSGKILVPTLCKFALSVAQVAIATIGLIEGYSATGGVTTGTTAITARSNQIGNSTAGTGLVYSAATITTPVWSAQLADGFTAGAFGGPQVPIDLKGIYVLLPGAYIAFGALTAVTGLGWLSWEEVDAPNGP
jgi:hypothetical protein